MYFGTVHANLSAFNLNVDFEIYLSQRFELLFLIYECTQHAYDDYHRGLLYVENVITMATVRKQTCCKLLSYRAKKKRTMLCVLMFSKMETEYRNIGFVMFVGIKI